MIGEIEDTSSKTQEPRPAPLRRAPIELGLVVVVVRELGCGAFPIFVDVARRPAHFLLFAVVSRVLRAASAAFARRQSCSKSRLCCLALHSDAFAPPKSFVATDWQLSKPERPLRAAFAAGQPGVLFAHQLMAKGSVRSLSLQVQRGTYGRQGAGKASARIFWSCELVQRHTRNDWPRLDFLYKRTSPARAALGC